MSTNAFWGQLLKIFVAYARISLVLPSGSFDYCAVCLDVYHVIRPTKVSLGLPAVDSLKALFACF